MKVERPTGMNMAMFERMRQLTSAELSVSASPTLQADMQSFEQEMARERADDQSSDDDESSSFTPFDLLRALPQAQDTLQEASLCPALSQVVFDIVQELYVCDERASRREVRVVLTEDMLPGVRLSVYEAEGRMVADFACSVESSRECLCQISNTLATELAERLKRDTRVSVRTDDPDDPCTLQVDGMPSQDKTAQTGLRSDVDARMMEDHAGSGRES